MNYNYPQLHEWFMKFEEGKSFITSIYQIITPRSEVGSLINLEENNGVTSVNLIVFNHNYIITGSFLNNTRGDSSKNSGQIKVYHAKDITVKEVSMSNAVSRNDEREFTNFNYSLKFSNGGAVNFAKEDYPDQQVPFDETLSKLFTL